MKLNVKEFLSKNTSLQMAICAGALISGGCAPQVFKPSNIIPPPVIEPPAFSQSQQKALFAPVEMIKEDTYPTEFMIIEDIAPFETEAPLQRTFIETLPVLETIDAQSIQYTVKKGDSIWKIAREYGISMRELADFNRIPLRKMLVVGQKISLPPGAEFVPANKRPAIKPTRKPARKTAATKRTKTKRVKQVVIPSDGKHIVKKGDSPWSIAIKYNLKTSTLLDANNLPDNPVLRAGQVLEIPVTGSKKQVTKKPKSQPVANVTPVETTPAENIIDPVDDFYLDGIDIDNIDIEKYTTTTTDSIFEDTEMSIINENETLDLDSDMITDMDNAITESDIAIDLEQIEFSDVVDMDSELNSLINAQDDGLYTDEPAVINVIEDQITVEDFAKRYGRKAEAIIELNPSLTATGVLIKGMSIKVPTE